jgi:coenzyme F420-reducing hydrogenase alpha subunit
MESEIINQLAPLGTTGLFLIVIYLTRKEILQVLFAPKADKMSDRLLSEMNGLFARNIAQVDELKSTLLRIETLLGAIKDELIRGRG